MLPTDMPLIPVARHSS